MKKAIYKSKKQFINRKSNYIIGKAIYKSEKQLYNWKSNYIIGKAII